MVGLVRIRPVLDLIGQNSEAGACGTVDDAKRGGSGRLAAAASKPTIRDNIVDYAPQHHPNRHNRGRLTNARWSFRDCCTERWKEMSTP